MNQQIVDCTRCTHPDCSVDSDVRAETHKGDPVVVCGGCDRILYRTMMDCPDCGSTDWRYDGRDDETKGIVYRCENCGDSINFTSQE